MILQSILGENGPKIKLLAQGIDDSQVVCPEEVKSISRETTFSENITDLEQLYKVLLIQSQKIGYTTRKQGYAGKTVTLKVRFAPFITVQKSITLPRATNLDNTIYQTAKELMNSISIRQPGIRLLGVKLSSLQQDIQPRQLSLIDNRDGEEKWKKLTSSVDKIQEKYGSSAIKRAALLRKEKKTE